jgi:beta-glucosidase/6-phospho-beta-glucosidase/beta-galactosidase
VRRFVEAANRHGVQIQWALMHYGTPADVSLLDDTLCERFATFARAAAEVIASCSNEPPVYTPVNEIGFLAWGASQTRLFHPYGKDDEKAPGTTLNDGFNIKCRLVKAALAGMKAIREVDPSARFLHVEPIVHVVPPANQPDLQSLADEVASYQWQVWDLLGGTLLPELGGHPEALDLIGVNHYHSGQWEVITEKRLDWHLNDPRRRPLQEMLQAVWRRYGRHLAIAETSHIGVGRAAWLDDVAAQVRQALAAGVPVRGVCLYPIVDRPDWDNFEHWHNSGMWDHIPGEAAEGGGRRRLNQAYADALQGWMRQLPR